jgi:ribonucleotide monophosphatase NagD (HAD superfamily)
MNFKNRLAQLINWSKENEGCAMILVTNPNSESPRAYINKLFSKLINSKSYDASSFSLSVSIMLCRFELSNGVILYIAESEKLAKEVLANSYIDYIGVVQDDGSILMHETFFKGDVAAASANTAQGNR